MNLNTRAKVITLDWDQIPIYDAYKRCEEIFSQFIVSSVTLKRSPTKGFHVIVHFHIDVNVVQQRYKMGDDPYRLLNDILNRPAHIHDILWDRKIIMGKSWRSQHLNTWSITNLEDVAKYKREISNSEMDSYHNSDLNSILSDSRSDCDSIKLKYSSERKFISICESMGIENAEH